jgi:anti-sigma regulatory factor (Ser/Thr protein kinase)
MTADSQSGVGVGGGVDSQFAAHPKAVRHARALLQEWLDGPGGVQGERASDLLVVLSEMASNSVRAGASWFRVKVWRDGADVALEVADDGCGFDAAMPAADEVPSTEAESGRGLYLVRSLVDRCTIFTNDSGTIVRCRVELRA